MRICANLWRLGLLVCLLMVAGCADTGVNSSEDQAVRKQSKRGREPIAVISIAPTQKWLADLQGMSSNSFELVDMDIDQIAKQLPGTDLQKPVTILLYASKRQTVQPVVYLPVANYEQFLNGLAKRVRLNRAFASSFMVGSQKILVKQVGDFAVFGTSLKQINAAPTSPESFRDELPSGADFAIKVNADSLRESEKQKLAKLVCDYLGDSFEPMNFDAGSIILGLSIDSKAGIQLQTQLSPVPENPEKFQQSLNDAMVKRGLPFSSEIAKNKLIFDLKFNADQLDAAWSLVSTMLADSYQAQQKTLIQQVSNSYRAPLPKITYINSGFSSSSSQSSSSGGRSRSGGG
jgi:hypothetical protein